MTDYTYWKNHRDMVPPTDVCMVGGYYAEEDLPSLSDDALDIMIGQSQRSIGMYEGWLAKETDKDLVDHVTLAL